MNFKVPTHSSIIINDEIYFDPYNLVGSFTKAKYIFITHSHYDHFSIEDIEKIISDQTIIIATSDVCKTCEKYFKNKIVEIKPNNQYKVDEIEFSTFPSYNLNKPFHPKSNNWVGYNLYIENQNVVVVGDSDITEELLSQKVDILFVPIGGTYTMNPQEASALTNKLSPKTVIPVHYGSIVGTKEDEEKFKEGLNKNINVMVCIK